MSRQHAINEKQRKYVKTENGRMSFRKADKIYEYRLGNLWTKEVCGEKDFCLLSMISKQKKRFILMFFIDDDLLCKFWFKRKKLAVSFACRFLKQKLGAMFRLQNYYKRRRCL